MFCEKCGSEMIPVKADGFNRDTGQPRTKMVCKSGSCSCNGHDYEKTKIRWWSSVTGICRRCGKREYGLNGIY